MYNEYKGTETAAPVKTVEEILEATERYLDEEGYKGFADSDKNPEEGNQIEVHDVPGFLQSLQNADILPADCYTQFTLSDNDSSYLDMCSKFIVFDGIRPQTVLAVIPVEDVLLNGPMIIEGLTREGMELFAEAYLSATGAE